MSILVIGEMREGEVRSSLFPVIAAAKTLAGLKGCSFDIALLGTGSDAGAASVKGYGAANVYFSTADVVANYTAEAYSAAFVAARAEKGWTILMSGATTTGKDLMPRIAGLLGAGMVSDVIGFEAESYLRPMYAGNAIAKVAVNTELATMTVRETAFDAAAAEGGESAVSELTFDVDAGSMKSKFLEFKLNKSERPDLAEASIIVSGGRGVKDAEGMKMIEAFADQLGAAVGASRAVVDEGLVPNDLQVGQTGKIVAPDLYIACGISGAIQHVAGIKDSKVIVAINKDEEAPIFEVADYGLVADLSKVIPELQEKLK